MLCKSTRSLPDPLQARTKEQLKTELGRSEGFSQKKTDLSAVTDRQVKQVEQFLNDRPVRKFNYQTPNQVLQGKIALIT